MLEHTPDTLVAVRAMWASAREKLDSAQLLHSGGHYNDSLSRSYYSAFHAVTLLFFLQKKSFSKHSTLIGNFNREFIFSGILPKELGKILNSLYESRQSGDYDVFLAASSEESLKGIDDAGLLLKSVADYCRKEFQIDLRF